VLSRAIANREFTTPVEWAVFAMVANRALAPDSKRGVVEWVDKDVALGNDAPIALQHLYRAMDVLLENDESIQKEVFFSTARGCSSADGTDPRSAEPTEKAQDTSASSVQKDRSDPRKPVGTRPNRQKPGTIRKKVTITMSAHLPLSNPGVRFVHADHPPIGLQRPHPRPVLKRYQVEQIEEVLKGEGLI